MKNKKYWFFALIIIVALIWYFWEKIEKMIPEKLQPSVLSSGSSSGSLGYHPAPTNPDILIHGEQPAPTNTDSPIQSDTTTLPGKFYQYGSGGFYYNETMGIPSKEQLLSFVPRLHPRGAFHRLN